VIGTDVPSEANGGDTSARLAKISAKIDSKASAITPVRKKIPPPPSIWARRRLDGIEFFNGIGQERS
jgi:hypothetical protein